MSDPNAADDAFSSLSAGDGHRAAAHSNRLIRIV
jgi:hypothetical protein